MVRELLMAAIVAACLAAAAPASTQDVPKAPKRGTHIAWGKPLRGLETGIELQEGSRRYAVGQTVKLNVYLRNVGEQPIDISYAIYPDSPFRPQVLLSTHKRAPMHVALVGALEDNRKLKPGDTLLAGAAEMTLMRQGDTNAAPLIPAYALSPGRYTVLVGGNEKDSSIPDSGTLSLEVGQK